MRALIPAIGLCLAAAAQAADPPVDRPDPRQNQKIERIRVEDDAVRIDELRYAGQTQSISVQPKGRLPAYEIQPGSGQRVWNLLKF